VKKNKLLTGSVLALGLLLAPAGFALTQDEPAALPVERGDDESMITLIGQLSRDSSGLYVLVEQESGDAIRVTGPQELADYLETKVEVTGEWVQSSEGDPIFQVAKIRSAN
jgi:hypothetical protein